MDYVPGEQPFTGPGLPVSFFEFSLMRQSASIGSMISDFKQAARGTLPICASLLVFSGVSTAAPSAADFLIGKWKSNAELSLPTIKLKMEMTPDKKAAWEKIFGHLQITYTATEANAFLPTRPAIVPGKAPLTEFRTTGHYVLASANATQVVIITRDAETKEQRAETLTFEGADRFWIRLPLPEGREYFDRIKPAVPSLVPAAGKREPLPN